MKKMIQLSLLVLSLLFTAACGTSQEATGENTIEKVTIEHELGETVIEKNPKAVVTFDMAALDTLDRLGVEVTGVPKDSLPTYLSDYAGDAYTNVGGLKEPDFETISELAPDLIIISGRQAELYEEFTKIAPTLYLGMDYSDYTTSFKHNTEILGDLFDKSEEVVRELETIDLEIAKVNEHASNVEGNALVVLANEGKVSAYGPNSRFGIIHDEFGVQAVDPNIEASIHGQSISFEYIAEKNPDYLFVIDRGAVVGGKSSAKQVVENPIVKETNAYKNGNIVYLNAEYWYTVGAGLTSISEMAKEIKTAVN